MQWKTRGRGRCSPLSLPPGDGEANGKKLRKLACKSKRMNASVQRERGFEEEDEEEE